MYLWEDLKNYMGEKFTDSSESIHCANDHLFLVIFQKRE